MFVRQPSGVQLVCEVILEKKTRAQNFVIFYEISSHSIPYCFSEISIFPPFISRRTLWLIESFAVDGIMNSREFLLNILQQWHFDSMTPSSWCKKSQIEFIKKRCKTGKNNIFPMELRFDCKFFHLHAQEVNDYRVIPKKKNLHLNAIWHLVMAMLGNKSSEMRETWRHSIIIYHFQFLFSFAFGLKEFHGEKRSKTFNKLPYLKSHRSTYQCAYQCHNIILLLFEFDFIVVLELFISFFFLSLLHNENARSKKIPFGKKSTKFHLIDSFVSENQSISKSHSQPECPFAS